MFGYFKKKKINAILVRRAGVMAQIQYYDCLPTGLILSDKGHSAQAERYCEIAECDEELLQLGHSGPDISFVMDRIMGKKSKVSP